jgi:two-component system, chemotaxis family, sensor kinase Cph1
LLTAGAQDLGSDQGADSTALLALISRRLRGSLHTLSTSAEVLSEDIDSLGKDQFQRLVTGIHQQALGLQVLAENALCFAAMQQGRYAIRPIALPLSDVFAETQPAVAPLLTRQQQVLRIHPTRGLPPAYGDAQAIRQALVNVILWASASGGTGAVIDVAAKRHGAEVRVSVSVHPNESMAAAGSILEALAAAGETDHYSFGLAVSKRIVEAHHGRMTAPVHRQGHDRLWLALPCA